MIGRMGRRTVAVCCVAVLAAGAVAACSTGSGDPVVAPPAPVAPASVPPTVAAPTETPRPSRTSPAPARQAAVSPVPITPPPGRAPVKAFAVGTRKLTFNNGSSRPLPTWLWYPAQGAAGQAPAKGLQPAVGRFPVVLFSHGLTAAPTDYADMLAKWAAAGFIVAAPAYPFTSTGVKKFNPLDVINQPADASKVISGVLALQRRPGDPLQDRINVGRTAAAGHSGGGITTVGLFTSSRDDRLDAGIVLAGRQLLPVAFSGAPAAMLFVHGKKDKTVRYAEGLAAFKAVPWSRAMLGITGGGHLARGRDFDVAVATSIEFLRWSLYGDAAAKRRIATAASERGVATFIDDL
jgi:fermentation-respiration switch protein FrsA (DUF1100 family)